MTIQSEFVTKIMENDINTVDHNISTNTQIAGDKFRTAPIQYSGMDPQVRPKLSKT